jgi:Family of unknown function (DUF6492)
MRYLLFCVLFPIAAYSQTQYALIPEPIDVVVPCAMKDYDTLEPCLHSIREYGENIRRIIVISKERLTDAAEWYDERDFPFSLRDLIVEVYHGDEAAADAFIAHPQSRAGWIFQQFLKLYAPFVIPGISSNVLIVDSDLVFINPMKFMTDDGMPIFNVGTENWAPYFSHARRLLGLKRVFPDYSGICNYMLFQRVILEDLFQCIYDQHQIDPWRALCRCVDNRDLFAPLSEYEIYFNFTLSRTDQYEIRPLNWKTACDWQNIVRYQEQGVSYLTCHRWMRG